MRYCNTTTDLQFLLFFKENACLKSTPVQYGDQQSAVLHVGSTTYWLFNMKNVAVWGWTKTVREQNCSLSGGKKGNIMNTVQGQQRPPLTQTFSNPRIAFSPGVVIFSCWVVPGVSNVFCFMFLTNCLILLFQIALLHGGNEVYCIFQVDS